MGPTHDWLGRGIETLIHDLGQTSFKALSGPDFDVVIVGSGYGGAVAASRFARAKGKSGTRLKVCVLERGQEYRPGDFPTRFSDLPGEVRFSRDSDDDIVGSPLGVFDFHVNKDITVLTANGLGGGSLINAGVAERVGDDVWDSPEWPSALREERATFSNHYMRAEQMLAVKKMPRELWPQKTRQMEELGTAFDKIATHGSQHNADARSKSFRPTNVAINYTKRVNVYGIEQQACQQCGDCFTGCNFGAKNTLSTNYLPDAKRFGAQLYTGATVSFIERIEIDKQKYWRIWFVITDTITAPSRQVAYFITAKQVVLAAGTLGTTEILFRSELHGLTLSPALGTRFSGNGDMIWAGYRQSAPVHITDREHTPFEKRNVGPTITSMIDLRDTSCRSVVQDAAIPAALYRAFSELITTTGTLHRLTRYSWHSDGVESDPDAVNPTHIDHTAVYLSMTRTAATGRIAFRDSADRNDGQQGCARIVWADASKDALYSKTEKALQSAVEELGGELLANPMWRFFPKQITKQLGGPTPPGAVISVHPLGGCPMGDEFNSGVVDHAGAVYDGRSSTSVHDGLYVFDGSVIPTSLGINPLLTISALAERAAQIVAKKFGWVIDYAGKIPMESAETSTALRLQPVETSPRPANTRLKFTEVMNGSLSGNGRSGAWSVDPFRASLAVDFDFKQSLENFLPDRHRQMRIDFARLHLADGATVELEGTVTWLNEVRRHPAIKVLRGILTYLRTRARMDILAAMRAGRGREFLAKDHTGLLKIASHVGTERVLIYALKPKRGQAGHGEWRLVGTKNVEYAVGNNLWRSLSDLRTKITEIDTGQLLASGTVSLDWRDMFAHNSLQLAGCESNPDAWMDLISMGGFFLRSMLRIHFWSLRKPDYRAEKRSFPLPGPLGGVSTPSWHAVTVDTRSDQGRARPVQIGLTHYRPQTEETRDLTLPPVLLIHGFGASGLQFGTPQLDQNIVQHLCAEGRDVWVLELRTSVALPTSHDQWSLDEVAQEDIPTAVRFVLDQYPNRRYAKLDVVAHCIGSAMFNIAVLSGRLQNDYGHSLIRAAVMLQVGPIFVVSDSNRLRGEIATWLGDGLQADAMDSTVDQVTATWRDVMIDRMLATYPLPKDQEDQLRPRHWWNLRTDIADFLRSTGVFGRLFQQENVDDRIRSTLGDLLGRTNLTTYRQVLHAVDRERLVDRYGRSVYVTDENIAKYYRFPALFMHGQKNDVFSVDGIRQSVERLKSVFPTGDFAFEEIPGYGHLDPLVGKNAHADVYPIFSRFLAQARPFREVARVAGDSDISLMKPEIGPVLGWTRLEEIERFGDKQPRPVARVWVKANETRKPPVSVETILVDGRKRYVPGSYRSFPLVKVPNFGFAACDIVLPDAKADSDYSILICTAHRGFDTGQPKPEDRNEVMLES